MVLLIEPDFLPASIARPDGIARFWQGWLAWSVEEGIDYFLGRRLPVMLADEGLRNVTATSETALYNGGSGWARFWQLTVAELRPRLVSSGHLDDQSVDGFLERCADQDWWTQTIAFTAAQGRMPGHMSDRCP